MHFWWEEPHYVEKSKSTKQWLGIASLAFGASTLSRK